MVGGFSYKIWSDAFIILWHATRLCVAVIYMCTGPSELYHNWRHRESWLGAQTFVSPTTLLWQALTPLEVTDRPDLVIAHFREDLGWLEHCLDKVGRVYVYCKDAKYCMRGIPLGDWQKERLHIVHLANEGRESHSYLYHLVHNYQNPAQRTVFTLGSLNGNFMRWASFRRALERERPEVYVETISQHEHQTILDYEVASKSGVAYSMGDGYDHEHKAQFSAANVAPASVRPFSSWYKKFLGEDLTLHNKELCTAKETHGAIISVSKAQWLHIPVQTYRALLVENSGANATESGYFMERAWRYMFCKV